MECFWSDPTKHPQCPHGPTLLFGKYKRDGSLKKFYICAACRQKKMCKFFLVEGENLPKEEAAKWEQERKQFASRYNHRSLYVRFNEVMNAPADRRLYCFTCDQLILKNEGHELDKHENHQLKEGLTDYQMKHPTEILKPLENSRQEAQYFFTKQSTEDIVNILVKLGAKQLLCIGTPKIHEYILDNHEDKISSLLLDLDGRFHNFYGPLSYCWYNLLNNHFFNQESMRVFKDFIMQNNGKDMYLVCDPPFGSRVEPISWTIKKISDLHKKWNNIEDENDHLKIMFIFPYFMESIMKQKSNPPDISGGLKDLKMTDYKVSYDNHVLFKTDKTAKLASPIRLFTNVPLNLVQLPKSQGYRYCTKCKKWVAKENKHCKLCNECTSKNGLTYKHCDICNRCVKPNWNHCETCIRCVATNHVCGQKPKITGKCFKCNERGHTMKECVADKETHIKMECDEPDDTKKECDADKETNTKMEKVKKRKAGVKKEMIKGVKKRKVDNSRKSNEGQANASVIKSTRKVPVTLKKKGKNTKIATELKVKTLKKPRLLKIHKKIIPRKQPNKNVKTK